MFSTKKLLIKEMEKKHYFLLQLFQDVETVQLEITILLLVQPIKLRETKLATGPGWQALDSLAARETGSTNVVPL